MRILEVRNLRTIQKLLFQTHDCKKWWSHLHFFLAIIIIYYTSANSPSRWRWYKSIIILVSGDIVLDHFACWRLLSANTQFLLNAGFWLTIVILFIIIFSDTFLTTLGSFAFQWWFLIILVTQVRSIAWNLLIALLSEVL
jgi:hypothetical protein